MLTTLQANCWLLTLSLSSAFCRSSSRTPIAPRLCFVPAWVSLVTCLRRSPTASTAHSLANSGLLAWPARFAPTRSTLSVLRTLPAGLANRLSASLVSHSLPCSSIKSVANHGPSQPQLPTCKCHRRHSFTMTSQNHLRTSVMNTHSPSSNTNEPSASATLEKSPARRR